jgi:hypothetical protein
MTRCWIGRCAVGEVVWRPNATVTRMHAVDAMKCGPVVIALCGWAVDERVNLIGGNPPPRCKTCERKTDGQRS